MLARARRTSPAPVGLASWFAALVGLASWFAAPAPRHIVRRRDDCRRAERRDYLDAGSARDSDGPVAGQAGDCKACAATGAPAAKQRRDSWPGGAVELALTAGDSEGRLGKPCNRPPRPDPGGHRTAPLPSWQRPAAGLSLLAKPRPEKPAWSLEDSPRTSYPDR